MLILLLLFNLNGILPFLHQYSDLTSRKGALEAEAKKKVNIAGITICTRSWMED
jgi:hypothetical protein